MRRRRGRPLARRWQDVDRSRGARGALLDISERVECAGTREAGLTEAPGCVGFHGSPGFRSGPQQWAVSLPLERMVIECVIRDPPVGPSGPPMRSAVLIWPKAWTPLRRLVPARLRIVPARIVVVVPDLPGLHPGSHGINREGSSES